jgi:hypothetical protein
LVLLQSTPGGCLSSSHTKWKQLKQCEKQINKTDRQKVLNLQTVIWSIGLSQRSTAQRSAAQHKL